LISLKLGKLKPGNEAIIHFVVVQDVQLVGGAFAYNLPQSYFPDYKCHPARYGELKTLNYKINFSFKILSAEKITYLSVPEGVKTNMNLEETEAVISGE